MTESWFALMPIVRLKGRQAYQQNAGTGLRTMDRLGMGNAE